MKLFLLLFCFLCCDAVQNSQYWLDLREEQQKFWPAEVKGYEQLAETTEETQSVTVARRNFNGHEVSNIPPTYADLESCEQDGTTEFFRSATNDDNACEYVEGVVIYVILPVIFAFLAGAIVFFLCPVFYGSRRLYFRYKRRKAYQLALQQKQEETSIPIPSRKAVKAAASVPAFVQKRREKLIEKAQKIEASQKFSIRRSVKAFVVLLLLLLIWCITIIAVGTGSISTALDNVYATTNQFLNVSNKAIERSRVLKVAADAALLNLQNFNESYSSLFLDPSVVSSGLALTTDLFTLLQNATAYDDAVDNFATLLENTPNFASTSLQTSQNFSSWQQKGGSFANSSALVSSGLMQTSNILLTFPESMWDDIPENSPGVSFDYYNGTALSEQLRTVTLETKNATLDQLKQLDSALTQLAATIPGILKELDTFLDLFTELPHASPMLGNYTQTLLSITELPAQDDVVPFVEGLDLALQQGNFSALVEFYNGPVLDVNATLYYVGDALNLMVPYSSLVDTQSQEVVSASQPEVASVYDSAAAIKTQSPATLSNLTALTVSYQGLSIDLITQYQTRLMDLQTRVSQDQPVIQAFIQNLTQWNGDGDNNDGDSGSGDGAGSAGTGTGTSSIESDAAVSAVQSVEYSRELFLAVGSVSSVSQALQNVSLVSNKFTAQLNKSNDVASLKHLADSLNALDVGDLAESSDALAASLNYYNQNINATLDEDFNRLNIVLALAPDMSDMMDDINTGAHIFAYYVGKADDFVSDVNRYREDADPEMFVFDSKRLLGLGIYTGVFLLAQLFSVWSVLFERKKCAWWASYTDLVCISIGWLLVALYVALSVVLSDECRDGRAENQIRAQLRDDPDFIFGKDDSYQVTVVTAFDWYLDCPHGLVPGPSVAQQMADVSKKQAEHVYSSFGSLETAMTALAFEFYGDIPTAIDNVISSSQALISPVNELRRLLTCPVLYPIYSDARSAACTDALHAVTLCWIGTILYIVFGTFIALVTYISSWLLPNLDTHQALGDNGEEGDHIELLSRENLESALGDSADLTMTKKEADWDPEAAVLEDIPPPVDEEEDIFAVLDKKKSDDPGLGDHDPLEPKPQASSEVGGLRKTQSSKSSRGILGLFGSSSAVNSGTTTPAGGKTGTTTPKNDPLSLEDESLALL